MTAGLFPPQSLLPKGSVCLLLPQDATDAMMVESMRKQKVVIVGAGPVGALAALYAASRGDDVEVYELRGGMSIFPKA